MLSYNSSRVFIVFKNVCYGGSFGEISRNHQLTRRFTPWCVSSPSCTILGIFMLWVIRRHSTASRNSSAMRRLLRFLPT
ncbi:hypothetical protein MTR67_026282 [Solanum verrucosum]|uniref:Uncharacterized protein n=1 Tax=Solanum verrucosum TaxID=315347 RepID=A0AAF0R2N9_SOLVR|nr:hypothetical protein MTR67_026282 [Solanum verrucosum]